MDTRYRLALWSGLAGPLVGVATTLSAATASPTFSWTGSALSNLGAAGAATPWLFNGGLVASAILTAPFAWLVWADAGHPLQRIAAATFLASLAALGLVGLFPLGTALHTPVAVAYFLLLTFVTWVHGSGTVIVGGPRRGLLEIWLGIGHVLAWAGWVALPPDGLAIPELVGSLVLYAWIVLVARPSTSLGSVISTGIR